MGLFDNINADISDMFSDYEVGSMLDIEDRVMIAHVYQTFGNDTQDTLTDADASPFSNRGFRIVSKNDLLEETEYLRLVAIMYNRNPDKCLYCFQTYMSRTIGRRSFQCSKCSHQYYPTSKTIFERSTTPLKDWFRIIKSMSIDNFAIKDLERNFDMCYKTAHRIYHLIKNSQFHKKLSSKESTIEYQMLKKEFEIEIEKRKIVKKWIYV